MTWFLAAAFLIAVLVGLVAWLVREAVRQSLQADGSSRGDAP